MLLPVMPCRHLVGTKSVTTAQLLIHRIWPPAMIAIGSGRTATRIGLLGNTLASQIALAF
jgi:hypothetical protein